MRTLNLFRNKTKVFSWVISGLLVLPLNFLAPLASAATVIQMKISQDAALMQRYRLAQLDKEKNDLKERISRFDKEVIRLNQKFNQLDVDVRRGNLADFSKEYATIQSRRSQLRNLASELAGAARDLYGKYSRAGSEIDKDTFFINDLGLASDGTPHQLKNLVESYEVAEDGSTGLSNTGTGNHTTTCNTPACQQQRGEQTQSSFDQAFPWIATISGLGLSIGGMFLANSALKGSQRNIDKAIGAQAQFNRDLVSAGLSPYGMRGGGMGRFGYFRGGGFNGPQLSSQIDFAAPGIAAGMPLQGTGSLIGNVFTGLGIATGQYKGPIQIQAGGGQAEGQTTGASPQGSAAAGGLIAVQDANGNIVMVTPQQYQQLVQSGRIRPGQAGAGATGAGPGDYADEADRILGGLMGAIDALGSPRVQAAMEERYERLQTQVEQLQSLAYIRDALRGVGDSAGRARRRIGGARSRLESRGGGAGGFSRSTFSRTGFNRSSRMGLF